MNADVSDLVQLTDNDSEETPPVCVRPKADANLRLLFAIDWLLVANPF
jgi:hypothetical protein